MTSDRELAEAAQRAAIADRLVDEFYGGIAEKDWVCWALEAVEILEKVARKAVQ